MKYLLSRPKFLMFSLAYLTLFHCCGCPDTKSWEELTFPIMAWHGPDISAMDEDAVQGMIDAGFTANYSYGNREANLRALDVAHNKGLKLLIGDPRIQPSAEVNLQVLLRIDSVIADYGDHPALLGYYLRDEPSVQHFENLAKLQRYFQALDPEHLAYINLFPNYANETQLGVPGYEEHVSQFMASVRPRILSYDYYPITYAGLRDGYYENLEIIRRYALKYNVPFWAFTLSTEHYNYPRPAEGHLRFQLYCDLAYGAKGLQYFTYGYVRSERFYDALLDSTGEKTSVWYMAQSVNREILRLAPILKRLHSVEVYHSKPLPKGTKEFPPDFVITETQGEPLVAGFFRDENKIPYVLLVHRNYENAGDVAITVSGAVKSLIEIGKDTGNEVGKMTPEDATVWLRFEAGDGRLFRVEM